MRKLLFIPGIAICQFFTSGCGSSSSTEHISYDSSIVTPHKEAVSQPVTPVNQVQPAVQQSTTAQPATVTAPGMNPPHGQPGHRCDIAVGAPLNSAPAKPATVSTTPVVTSQPVTKTAPGMNPPHGQPGHRCDIAVGAPLNSAPVKAPTVTTTPAATTPVTADASVTADSAVKQ